MNQKLKLTIQGLYTDPNSLSQEPEGALAVADNIVIDRPSVAESRRGFKQFNTALDEPIKLFNFQNTILVQDDDTLVVDDGMGSWDDITGTLEAPSADTKVQSIQAVKSLFLTTALGIQKLESLTADLEPAGAPAGLDLKLALDTGSFLPNDDSVAYRIVWGKVDVNGVLTLGAPSENVNISNSGAPSGVELDFTVPLNLTDEWFYRVYRSLLSGDADIPGGDELQLVFQAQLTNTDISNGYITITDDTPEEVLGEALYTNATQEGIAQANNRPPFAHDVAMFNNFPFYLNTKQPHFLTLEMIALPTAGDEVTLNSIVYTAAATENIASHEFEIGSGGTLLENIVFTLHSLIRNINRDSRLPDIYGYFVGGQTILIQKQDFADDFEADCDNDAVFREVLPITSTNDEQINRLYIGKELQPGAVPILQFIDIGRADKAGLRIKSVRDALFIMKEDGVWRLTGTSPDNFVVEQYDTTIKCVGSETVDAFENTVFSATNKGIMAISVSGSEIPSLPIQNEVLRIEALTNFSLSWGAAYDSDRKYLFGVPNASIASDVEFVYVYNAKTNGWTKWPLDWRHALVGEGDDKLYAIRISDGQILQERKSLTLDDYADDQFSVTITVVNVNDLTMSSVADLEVGMTLVQGSQKGVITEINGSVVTVDVGSPWDTGAAIAFTPIPVRLRWSEEDAGNPGLLKQWPEITFLFQQCRFKELDFACSSNFKTGFQLTTLASRTQAGWGAFAWSSLPWGTGRGGFQAIRTYFPREVARSLWQNIELRLSQCFNSFALSGASVLYNLVSSRFK